MGGKTKPKYSSGIKFSNTAGKGTRGIDFNIPSANAGISGVPTNNTFNWQNFADPSIYGTTVAPASVGSSQPYNFNTSPVDFTNSTQSNLSTGLLNLQSPQGTPDFGSLSAPTFSGSDVPDKPFSFADWGSKNKDLINGGVGIANSLANAYFGWKNLGLAKDQFNFQKESWNKNFANQVITTNNQLEEQARKRYSNSPTSNMTPEEYMAKHRVQ